MNLSKQTIEIILEALMKRTNNLNEIRIKGLSRQIRETAEKEYNETYGALSEINREKLK